MEGQKTEPPSLKKVYRPQHIIVPFMEPSFGVVKRRISDSVISSPLVGSKAAWSEYEDLIKPNGLTPKKLSNAEPTTDSQPKPLIDRYYSTLLPDIVERSEVHELTRPWT